MPFVETERLRLRRWSDSDRSAFACINNDPRVMEFMPALQTRDESDALADRIADHFRLHNFGLYAAELKEDRTFIGYVGLAVPSFEAHFTPCCEIGWRLSSAHWGKGLATEAARQVVRLAEQELGLKELVSFTVPANVRSRRVMEKLGMTRDVSEDFDHPKLPDCHPLRRHVLYRLRLR